MILNKLWNTFQRLRPEEFTSEINEPQYLKNRETAKFVLGVESLSLDENDPTKQLLRETIVDLKTSLSQLTHYKSLLEALVNVMTSAWNHPVLIGILRGDDIDMKKGLAYIETYEHPVLLHIRVDLLLSNGCQEFAKNLISWCSKSPLFESDAYIMFYQLMFLCKSGKIGEFLKLCQTISCFTACKILAGIENASGVDKAVAYMISQTFLVIAWMKKTDLSCTKELLRIWLKLSYLRYSDDEGDFVGSIKKVVSMSNDIQQLIAFIEVMQTEFGDKYMTCCMKAAFQALRLARHNFDCARLYRLDKIACDEATSQLVQICGILEKFFKDHLSVKLSCLLSLHCLNPSDTTYFEIEKCFIRLESLPASLQQPTFGDNQDVCDKLLFAIKMLRPEQLMSISVWLEVKPILLERMKSIGWKYDAGSNKFTRPRKKLFNSLTRRKKFALHAKNLATNGEKKDDNVSDVSKTEECSKVTMNTQYPSQIENKDSSKVSDKIHSSEFENFKELDLGNHSDLTNGNSGFSKTSFSDVTTVNSRVDNLQSIRDYRFTTTLNPVTCVTTIQNGTVVLPTPNSLSVQQNTVINSPTTSSESVTLPSKNFFEYIDIKDFLGEKYFSGNEIGSHVENIPYDQKHPSPKESKVTIDSSDLSLKDNHFGSNQLMSSSSKLFPGIQTLPDLPEGLNITATDRGCSFDFQQEPKAPVGTAITLLDLVNSMLASSKSNSILLPAKAESKSSSHLLMSLTKTGVCQASEAVAPNVTFPSTVSFTDSSASLTTTEFVNRITSEKLTVELESQQVNLPTIGTTSIANTTEEFIPTSRITDRPDSLAMEAILGCSITDNSVKAHVLNTQDMEASSEVSNTIEGADVNPLTAVTELQNSRSTEGLNDETVSSTNAFKSNSPEHTFVIKDSTKGLLPSFENVNDVRRNADNQNVLKEPVEISLHHVLNNNLESNVDIHDSNSSNSTQSVHGEKNLITSVVQLSQPLAVTSLTYSNRFKEDFEKECSGKSVGSVIYLGSCILKSPYSGASSSDAPIDAVHDDATVSLDDPPFSIIGEHVDPEKPKEADDDVDLISEESGPWQILPTTLKKYDREVEFNWESDFVGVKDDYTAVVKHESCVSIITSKNFSHFVSVFDDLNRLTTMAEFLPSHCSRRKKAVQSITPLKNLGIKNSEIECTDGTANHDSVCNPNERNKICEKNSEGIDKTVGLMKNIGFKDRLDESKCGNTVEVDKNYVSGDNRSNKIDEHIPLNKSLIKTELSNSREKSFESRGTDDVPNKQSTTVITLKVVTKTSDRKGCKEVCEPDALPISNNEKSLKREMKFTIQNKYTMRKKRVVNYVPYGVDLNVNESQNDGLTSVPVVKKQRTMDICDIHGNVEPEGRQTILDDKNFREDHLEHVEKQIDSKSVVQEQHALHGQHIVQGQQALLHGQHIVQAQHAVQEQCASEKKFDVQEQHAVHEQHAVYEQHAVQDNQCNQKDCAEVKKRKRCEKTEQGSEDPIKIPRSSANISIKRVSNITAVKRVSNITAVKSFSKKINSNQKPVMKSQESKVEERSISQNPDKQLPDVRQFDQPTYYYKPGRENPNASSLKCAFCQKQFVTYANWIEHIKCKHTLNSTGVCMSTKFATGVASSSTSAMPSLQKQSNETIQSHSGELSASPQKLEVLFQGKTYGRKPNC